jgi:hypothetical protein
MEQETEIQQRWTTKRKASLEISLKTGAVHHGIPEAGPVLCV